MPQNKLGPVRADQRDGAHVLNADWRKKYDVTRLERREIRDDASHIVIREQKDESACLSAELFRGTLSTLMKPVI